MPTVEGNRFEVLECVGEGSFGKVYKGFDKATKEVVALKFIEKNLRKHTDLRNIRSEINLLKEARHPHVIQLRESIETPQRIIIITEFANKDLAEVLNKERGLSLERIRKYASQIVAAMMHLRDRRIIHRDLKPHNILLLNDDVKICDFGFAKMVSISNSFVNSTKGTPLYLAPEIASHKPYTSKVDVWAFGIILYELYTGKPPFLSNCYEKLVPKILNESVKFPLNMPTDLRDLISAALQKKPSHRIDWEKVKVHPFFTKSAAVGPLQQISPQIPKLFAEISPQKLRLGTDLPRLLQQANQEGNRITPNQVVESPQVVVQKQNDTFLTLEADLVCFEQQRKFMQSNLDQPANLKQLKTDVIFYNSIHNILVSACVRPVSVKQEVIMGILEMFNNLITKVELPAEQADDDITKTKDLMGGLVKLIQTRKEWEIRTLAFSLMNLMLKSTFNGQEISFEMEGELISLVQQMVRDRAAYTPVQCLSRCLKTFGVMVNQAYVTLVNSQNFFMEVVESKLLTKIAACYRPSVNYAVVFLVLEVFLHPSVAFNTAPSLQMKRILKEMKMEVADTLLQMNFISSTSPLVVFGKSDQLVLSYCAVLLETMRVSKAMRKAFMQQSYWTDLLARKDTTLFFLAFNDILMREERVNIISLQLSAKITKKGDESLLIDLSLLQQLFFTMKQRSIDGFNEDFVETILNKILAVQKTDSTVRQKVYRVVYGTQQSHITHIDSILLEITCSIFDLVGSKLLKETRRNRPLRDPCASPAPTSKAAQQTNSKPKQTPQSESMTPLMQLFSRILEYWLGSVDLFQHLKIKSKVRFLSTLNKIPHLYAASSINRRNIVYLHEQAFEKEVLGALLQAGDVQDAQCSLHSFLDAAKQLEQYPSEVNFSHMLILGCKYYRLMFLAQFLSEQFLCRSLDLLAQSLSFLNNRSPDDQALHNFTSVDLLKRFLPFFSSREPQIILSLVTIITLLVSSSKSQKYLLNIRQLQILKYLPRCMQFEDPIPRKALNLIGHLTKQSSQFFEQIKKYEVLAAIPKVLERDANGTSTTISLVLAVGNITYHKESQIVTIVKDAQLFNLIFKENLIYFQSFKLLLLILQNIPLLNYSLFSNHIRPLIPRLSYAFQQSLNPNDTLISNTFSTMSNLLRHSSTYLGELHNYKLFDMAMNVLLSRSDSNKIVTVGLNTFNKALMYGNEFVDRFGRDKLVAILNRYGRDHSQHQCILKIRSHIHSSAKE